jgi:tetratricopeptide (TPR) repeat protein
MSPADNALLYGTLINALTKQKKFKEAQAELNKFSAADQEKYSVAVIFADYYSTQKQYKKAIECLNAVKKDTDAKVKRNRYFKICDYYLRQNDGKKALEYYRKAKTAVKDKWRVPGYEHRIKELHPEATF